MYSVDGKVMMDFNKLSILILFVVCFSFSGFVSAASDNNTTVTANSSGLADSDWPSFQNDANNTGQSGYNGPQTNTTKWTFDNITVYGSTVIGTDGTVYVAGADGVLHAFNSQGVLQWTWTTRSQILGSPTIGSDGTIYISNFINSTTYAISSNGTLLWKYNTGDYNFGSSPVIGSDGTIYVTVTNDTTGTLYAVSPSGTLKWKYITGIIYGNSPVIGSDATLYLADYDGVMYAINQDGTLKWSYKLKNREKNPIYYVNMRYDTPSIGPDGTIYIACSGTNRVVDGSSIDFWFYLFAIHDNEIEGSLKWVCSSVFGNRIGEPVYGSPTISSSGTIYVGSASRLYAITSDGVILWTYNTGGSAGNGLSSAIIGADGTIYVGGRNGLYALNPDGTLKWSYATGDIVGSPAISSNGTLYIGTTTGTFYAFNDLAADFTVGSVNGKALTQQFNGCSTSNPASWKWDFGDGNTSTEQNPQYSYSKAGKYTVTLNVTLTNGTVLSRTKTITIQEMDIIAPTVGANLVGGTYNDSQNVVLTAIDNYNNTVIYYTTDGTDPRTSSSRNIYTGPLVIDYTTALNFAAVDAAGNWSPVYTNVYVILNVIYVQSASYYNSNTINSDIQTILDGVKSGNTVVFLGTLYENLHLVINKPLNLVSYAGTGIITTSPGAAVFLINGPLSSGTQISGFNIVTNTTLGILVNNTSNVIISKVQVVSNGGSSITVNNSSGTIIENSNLSNSMVGVQITISNNTQLNGNTMTANHRYGMDIENASDTTVNGGLLSDNNENGVKIYNSSNSTISGVSITGNGKSGAIGSGEGGVYIARSNNVQVTNSQITGNGYGIATRDINGITLDHNTISDNTLDGLLLNGGTYSTSISTNYIQRNRNGIHINGSSEHLIINGNLITDSKYDCYDYMYSGQGIVFGLGSVPSSSLIIEHNIIVDNPRRSIETRYGRSGNFQGSNWFIVPDCFHNNWDPQIGMMLIQKGEGTFKFFFYDGNDMNKVVNDLVPIDVLLIMNDDHRIISTINGTLNVIYPVSKLLNSLTAMVYGRLVSLSIFNGLNSAGGDVKEYLTYYVSPVSPIVIVPGGDGEANQGFATPGFGQGSSTISWTNSGLNRLSSGYLNLGAVAGASSISGASSQGQTLQEIIVDNENQNLSLWGILVIILLIFAVMGIYYRKDIIKMVEKSKK